MLVVRSCAATIVPTDPEATTPKSTVRANTPMCITNTRHGAQSGQLHKRRSGIYCHAILAIGNCLVRPGSERHSERRERRERRGVGVTHLLRSLRSLR